MINYYQVLGLPFGASAEVIRKAYREYVKHFHPDKHQDSKFFTERFKDIQEAYEILIDEKRRRQFENSFQSNDSHALRHELAQERQKSATQAAKLSETEVQLQRLAVENTRLKNGEKKYNNNNFIFYYKNWKNTLKWSVIFVVSGLLFYKYITNETEGKKLVRESDYLLAMIRKDLFAKSVKSADSLLANRRVPLLTATNEKGDVEPRMIMADILVMRGYAKHMLNNDTGAVKDVTKATMLGSTSDDAKTFRIRGGIKLALGDTVGALEDYGSSTSMLYVSSRAYQQRAELYYSRKEYYKAMIDYKNALRIHPFDGDLLNEFANCYYSTGKLDSACIFWRKSGEQGSASAYYNIKLFCR